MSAKSTTLSLLAAAALFAATLVSASHVPSVHAAAPQVSPTAPQVVAGEAEAKRLVLLMDADKNGKVSRKEYMDFMAAEFDRLDVDHDGELNVKELMQSQLVQAPHTGTRR